VDRDAGQLRGAASDDLVGVHVGLGARAGLEHDEREFAVVFAGDHLVGRRDDRLDLVGRQLP
jgi:hypothetical protein